MLTQNPVDEHIQIWEQKLDRRYDKSNKKSYGWSIDNDFDNFKNFLEHPYSESDYNQKNIH